MKSTNNYKTAPHELHLAFDTLIADKLKNFVGRKFVFDEIDEFLDNTDNDSGYYIIRGDPGIGKTALMAKLVNDRGYIHYFNIASQNIRTVRQFLENISYQLIFRYNLEFQNVPLNSSENSAFLSICLNEAAKKRNNEKIVLVIDALDESDRSTFTPAVNTLFLPESLPNGVYVIITTRRLNDIRLNVANKTTLDLVKDSLQNLNDIRTYIENYTQRPNMRDRLQIINTDPKKFIKILCKKSEGNFMYLYYVLPAIEQGKFSDGTLDELPQGLEEYYNRHWRQMQQIDGKENFAKIYEPIIYTFGVVKEPVSIESIGYFTRLAERDVRNAINYWREFLDEQMINGTHRYRIYHSSFQEFLKDKTNLREYHKIFTKKRLERSSESRNTERKMTIDVK